MSIGTNRLGVRISGSALAALDKVARRRNVPRSELVRQAITALLAAEGDEPDTAVIYGGGDRVKFLLPVVDDDASPAVKEAVVLRNRAVLENECAACHARGTVEHQDPAELQPRTTTVKVKASSSTVVPADVALSPGATFLTQMNPDGLKVTRVAVTRRIDHKAGCPAGIH